MKRQFIVITSGRVVAALLQAVLLVFVARALGPSHFGLFSVVISIGILAQVLTDAGLGTLVIRERSSRPESPLLSAALRFSNWTALVLAASGLSVLTCCALLIRPEFWFLTPLALSTALERNADLWIGVALADGDTWSNALNLVVRRTVAILAFSAMEWAGVHALLAISIAMTLAGGISACTAHAYVDSRLVRAHSRVALKPVLTASWPYWLNSLAGQLKNVDTLIITSFAGNTAAGLYAAANRLSGPLLLVPTSLAAVVLPATARQAAARPTASLRQIKLKKLVITLTLVMTTCYASLAAVAPWLFPMLMGAEYAKAVPVFQIILISMCFASASVLTSAVRQGQGRPGVAARASVVSGIFSVGALMAGTSVFGIVGAAVGLLGSQVLQLLLLITGTKFFKKA